jgi:23S rRNA pseudouridine1911/1915/1917 synthase
MGLHVKGDLKYGAKRSDPNGGIRLHARSLSFPGPDGKRITVQADPPVRDNLWQSFIDSAENGATAQSN